MADKLSKEEFFKSLETGKASDQFDDLDKKAMQGYQYLDGQEPPADVLKRMEGRFSELLTNREATKPKVKIFTMRRLQSIAAAILILVLAGTYFLTRVPSEEILFAEYFQAPRSTYFQQTRGQTDSYDKAFVEAFRFYEMGSFAEAKLTIAKLKEEHPDKPDLIYYEAISALAAGNTTEAIELLTVCLSVTYQGVSLHVPWYMALSYLRQGDHQQAGYWLEKAQQVDKNRSAEVVSLLEKIN